MHIKGWIRSSLLDYPEKIAASLFCGGCNFRCPNCHNANLVLCPDQLTDVTPDEIWRFLEKRHGLLDGVVISGGEPTLQPDLLAFAARVREMGYQIKLDTNGYRPQVVESMLEARVVDYVAMDVKAPLLPDRYARAVGVEVDVLRVKRTIDLLLEGKVAYEFRTTVVPGILDRDDIAQIAQEIAGARHYYLQQFVPRNTLDPAMLKQLPYPPQEIRAMADVARRWVDHLGLRGV